MVHREELGNVIDNQVETLLEDPGRGEESWPGLDLVLESFGLRGHEESRVAAYLSEIGVSEGVLDYIIKENEGNRVVLHFGVVEVVQQEGRGLLDLDGEVAAIEGSGGLQSDDVVVVRGREEVAAHEHKLQENALELLGIGVDDLVLLESLQLAEGASGNIAAIATVVALRLVLLRRDSVDHVDEVHAVGVDDALVLRFNSEVVGDQLDGSLHWRCEVGSPGVGSKSIPASAVSLAEVLLALVEVSAIVHGSEWRGLEYSV